MTRVKKHGVKGIDILLLLLVIEFNYNTYNSHLRKFRKSRKKNLSFPTYVRSRIIVIIKMMMVVIFTSSVIRLVTLCRTFYVIIS